ncbi:MAG: TrkA family potassium uptake protein, partial [Candidatus Omnitrophota bacterium]
MYIIIIGAGKVGYFLAKRLVNSKHTVSIIDRNKLICEDAAKEIEALVINGDGCDPRILEEAGILRADVVAAVTGDDEDNLIICQLAKERFNIQRTVGRVNNPDNEHTFSELGIDIPVDSTKIIAKIIEEEVSFPDFV